MAAYFPSELLYEIVCPVVVEYIDEAIAGSFQIPQDQEKITLTAVNDQVEPVCERTAYDGDIALPKPKSILSLLSASYQLRSVTLKVLSDALEIPTVSDTLER